MRDLLAWPIGVLFWLAFGGWLAFLSPLALAVAAFAAGLYLGGIL